jgi:polar amino acid transport system ATP-binding protein
VRKSFGDNLVLDGIDLSIDRGAAIVVAGPSGSGKSTMLRCTNGLEPIDAGTIRSMAAAWSRPDARSTPFGPRSGWSFSSSTSFRT